MRKRDNTIKYHSNNKNPKEGFNNAIKNINIKDMLIGLCNLSIQAFVTKIKTKNSSFYKDKAALLTKENKCVEVDSYILPWNLVDIAYQAILSCKDYTERRTLTVNELNALSYLWADVQNREIANKGGFYRIRKNYGLYLYGMQEEQRSFQNLFADQHALVRDYYILSKISKKVKTKEIDYNLKKVIKKEVGVSIYSLISNLMLLALYGSANPIVDSDDENYKNEISNADYKKVVNYYSTTVNEVRKSPLGRQILISNPIVNIKGDRILINAYIPFEIIKHSLYWVSCNYYKKQNSQAFMNYFGLCFEEYLKELLKTYLNRNKYRKLEPFNKVKNADWELTIDNYHFLIEQKSSFLKLACKQQDPSVEDYEKYLLRNISEAIDQLISAEKIKNNDIDYYKIILLYDESVEPSVLNKYFELYNPSIKNKEKFWIVSISEFEELLYLQKYDLQLFKKIMDEKINNKNKQSFVPLFMNRNWKKHHISQKKYNKIMIKTKKIFLKRGKAVVLKYGSKENTI